MANTPDWEDDDDDPAPLPTRKVEIENRYFKKLKRRLTKTVAIIPDDIIFDEEFTAEVEKKPTGPVIYNDDGTVYKRPS